MKYSIGYCGELGDPFEWPRFHNIHLFIALPKSGGIFTLPALEKTQNFIFKWGEKYIDSTYNFSECYWHATHLEVVALESVAIEFECMHKQITSPSPESNNKNV